MSEAKLATMAGAPWNVLDESGLRVAIFHSNDLVGDATADDIKRARRAVACWNACVGIPTEVVEAGVVVVPVEVAREYVESHRVPPTPNAAENQRRIERAIAATQRLDEHLAAALSRLQQNGGADHD